MTKKHVGPHPPNTLMIELNYDGSHRPYCRWSYFGDIARYPHNREPSSCTSGSQGASLPRCAPEHDQTFEKTKYRSEGWRKCTTRNCRWEIPYVIKCTLTG